MCSVFNFISMVVFTCNHCGDSLQKPKVAKHYQFRCRNVPFLTCADCLKDFRGEEYNVHTKCITEAERYGGKNYVSKPNANKGERKQQEWICVVNNLLSGITNLSKAERNFLNTLSKYDNLPRKKVKFLNFVRSAVGNRVNMTVVESVWDKMETAHKQNQESVTQTREQDTTQIPEQNNDETTCTQNKDLNHSFDNQNIVENQNNENICKENGSSKQHNGNGEVCETNGDNVCERKSKKRRLKSTNDQIAEDVQPAAKISKTSTLETNENEKNSSPFDWKKIVLDVVQAKNEISLKKLQSKVIKKYKCYVSNTHDVSNLTDAECEEAIRKFNKTLKKMKKASVIYILEDIVKLPPLVE
ncbi:cell growth-regulating nucleolar protein isoform X2 [Nylanderia fulva]|uniref:cell growth-regulating nucleolar protein isoform X2 n=1 Tax=Nylanderia fulva TaxID=613905 RepID=UPI0010FAE108|nr:cell growth-regulating nucleolar protein isoform X2 [Nylanderia fulva]